MGLNIPVVLILLPAFLGIVCFFVRGENKRNFRRFFLVLGASLHAIGTVLLYWKDTSPLHYELIAIDPIGLLFLSIVSALFWVVSIYSLGYFHHERTKYTEEGVSHLYVPCMLFFLAAMTLTCVSAQVGILWIGIGATTIASTPLIYYHHHHEALEAAWKYLLICSVGIAVALLGVFFVLASFKGPIPDLSFKTLILQAKFFDPNLLRVGFLFVLVGFGTKVGLAPLHTWLPDAHSEAPSPVSALLSGALLNCAFLGVLRFYQILVAADLVLFASKLLMFFGIASLLTAAIFMVVQKDYKRLLAYSSIEHMGVLALGVGVGAPFGALLHAINHSLCKGLLFLTAGQILIAYRVKTISDIHGLLKTIPTTGFLFLLGGLAIVGLPPFAPFISEFLIFRDGFRTGHIIPVLLVLLFLSIIFISMSRMVLGMVQGEKRETLAGELPSKLMMIPSVFLAFFVLMLGLYLPKPLVSFLETASNLIGGNP